MIDYVWIIKQPAKIITVPQRKDKWSMDSIELSFKLYLITDET